MVHAQGVQVGAAGCALDASVTLCWGNAAAHLYACAVACATADAVPPPDDSALATACVVQYKWHQEMCNGGTRG